MGIRMGLALAQKTDMSVAVIWPTSAITDTVKGIPMIAKKMQNTLPAVVEGAI